MKISASMIRSEYFEKTKERCWANNNCCQFNLKKIDLRNMNIQCHFSQSLGNIATSKHLTVRFSDHLIFRFYHFIKLLIYLFVILGFVQKWITLISICMYIRVCIKYTRTRSLVSAMSLDN